MIRLLSAVTLYRFSGILVVAGDAAILLDGELRRLGARRGRNRATGLAIAGVPDCDPWRAALLARMEALGVAVEVVEGEPDGDTSANPLDNY